MLLLKIAVLGLVQGLTEFLPVSSSAHLVFARVLLGIQENPQNVFIFDVLVQMGTWFALVMYFFQDLKGIALDMLRGLNRKPGPSARLGWMIGLATVPAVIVGWLVKDWMSGALISPFFVSLFLLANGGLLVVGDKAARHSPGKRVEAIDALWIGGFQAIALLHGISRSGATMVGGMTRKLDRVEAARFAFLMAIPVMPAAALVALLDLSNLPDLTGLIPQILVGVTVATLSGYLCIRWFLGYLARNSLVPFAIYCWLVGFIFLIISLLA